MQTLAQRRASDSAKGFPDGEALVSEDDRVAVVFNLVHWRPQDSGSTRTGVPRHLRSPAPVLMPQKMGLEGPFALPHGVLALSHSPSRDLDLSPALVTWASP